MNALLAAQLLLLLGAALCLIPARNGFRAAVGLLSQAGATALVLSAAVPIVAGGPALVGELAWAYPVGTLRMRLDALGAFFLAWSLPMTLLGSVYAVGYLRRHFGTRTPCRRALRAAQHDGAVLRAGLHRRPRAGVPARLGDRGAGGLAAGDLGLHQPEGALCRLQLPGVHAHRADVPRRRLHDPVHALGSWELGSFGRWLQANPGSERNLVFLLLVTSFGLKSAFFPFHSWLPRAHAAAPAHVSALMSGVIHKAGLYALVRFVLLIGTARRMDGLVPDRLLGCCRP
jgi:hydrogenase-4 component B